MQLYRIPLQPIPNQELIVNIAKIDKSATIRLKQYERILTFDLKLDDVIICQSVLCKTGYNLIWPFLYKVKGELAFLFAGNKELVSYKDLDKEAELYYAIR